MSKLVFANNLFVCLQWMVDALKNFLLNFQVMNFNTRMQKTLFVHRANEIPSIFSEYICIYLIRDFCLKFLWKQFIWKFHFFLIIICQWSPFFPWLWHLWWFSCNKKNLISCLTDWVTELVICQKVTNSLRCLNGVYSKTSSLKMENLKSQNRQSIWI